MKLAYRPDIDGLRAISVLLVIFFHAGFSTFSGGFIGVDVFFVISGFLITSIIYTQVSDKTFRFSTFYKKRMKRILPPFYLVCISSLLAGLVIFTPQDLLDLGKHLRYAVSFVSNIFLLRNSGYFAPESETLPLLHTWSLAIEEQFYLVWPALLLLIKRRFKDTSLIFFALSLCLLSLAYSQYQLFHYQDAAYYQIQSRAWELLLGSILGLVVCKGSHTKIAFLNTLHSVTTISILGLALIIGPAIVYTEQTAFPGLNALLPCLGASLLILSGSLKNNLIARILSVKPIVFIGLLSYSLYLWHWPIIAYTRYLLPEFDTTVASLCIIATFAASVVSYYFVEKPLRYNRLSGFKLVTTLYLVIPVCTFLAMSKLIKNNDGFPERLSKDVVKHANIVFSEYDAPLSDSSTIPEFLDPYTIGKSIDNAAQADAILWGDSHAMHLYAAMDEIAKSEDFSFVAATTGACAPLTNAVQINNGRARAKGCEEKNQQTLSYILDSDIPNVVIAARWALHYETKRYINEAGEPKFLGSPENMEQSVTNTQRVFKASLDQLIAELEENGKTVFLVHQIPAHKHNPANCMIKNQQYPELSSGDCSIAYDEVKTRQAGYRQVFDLLSSTYPKLRIISFDSLICPNTRCYSELDETPLYSDHDHLNPVGSRLLAKKWLSENPTYFAK